MSTRLPSTENALLLRTDFSDDAAWRALCSEVSAMVGEFQAQVTPVSDPAWKGKTVEQLVAASNPDERSFLLVADRAAFGKEHPILVVDLADEPGRTFRVIPREAWSVENNLTLANMEFEEFASAADQDGVFRGFPDE